MANFTRNSSEQGNPGEPTAASIGVEQIGQALCFSFVPARLSGYVLEVFYEQRDRPNDSCRYGALD